MEKKVFSTTYGKVTAAVPTHSGQTLIRVKSAKYGSLHYFVDVCYIEEGESVTPRTVLGTLTLKEV